MHLTTMTEDGIACTAVSTVLKRTGCFAAGRAMIGSLSWLKGSVMDKETRILISNRINRIGCGHELLYCTRVYVNARTYGGAWIWMEHILDFGFWLLWGQKYHCRASYLFERRWHETQKKTNQKRLKETERETSGQATSKDEGKA